MKCAYLQCVGGVSGDMLLGAIIDAGVPVYDLNAAIAPLGVTGVEIVAKPEKRGGVHGTHALVEVDDASRDSYHLDDFIRIAEASSLSSVVKERSTAVFRRIRQAEEQVHRQSEGELHLGELGSVDTLVDVVCTVIGLEALGIDRLYCSPLPSGSGVIRTSHGTLPVPAPATSALLTLVHAPVVPPPGSTPKAGEMVTPTGAAIVTTLAVFSQPSLNIEKTGYGLGTRNPDAYPNVLALWVGEEIYAPPIANLSLLETNIDDTTPEVLASNSDEEEPTRHHAQRAGATRFGERGHPPHPPGNIHPGHSRTPRLTIRGRPQDRHGDNQPRRSIRKSEDHGRRKRRRRP